AYCRVDPSELWLTDLRERPPHRGVDGTGPVTGAGCRRPLKSLIDSPPRAFVRVMSIRTWPRSYTGSNPRRCIARDSPARRPVRSTSSRNGNTPANPTRRSSSPTRSSRWAHELHCTEELHLPQPAHDLRQSHSGWSAAPRPIYPEITPGESSTLLKDGGRGELLDITGLTPARHRE